MNYKQIIQVKQTVWHEIQIKNRRNDKSAEISYKWIYADSQGREIYPRKEMISSIDNWDVISWLWYEKKSP